MKRIGKLAGLGMALGLAGVVGCGKPCLKPIGMPPQVIIPTRGEPLKKDLENWRWEEGHLYRKKIEVGCNKYFPESLEEARELEEKMIREYDEGNQEWVKKHRYITPVQSN